MITKKCHEHELDKNRAFWELFGCRPVPRQRVKSFLTGHSFFLGVSKGLFQVVEGFKVPLARLPHFKFLMGREMELVLGVPLSELVEAA